MTLHSDDVRRCCFIRGKLPSAAACGSFAIIVDGAPRGAPALGLRDHRIGAAALRRERAEARPNTVATAVVVPFLGARDWRRIPSRQDSRGAIIAAVAVMNGEKRQPDHKDQRGDDPGTQHLTKQIGKAPRPALSSAMCRHDTQLQLVLGNEAGTILTSQFARRRSRVTSQ